MPTAPQRHRACKATPRPQPSREYDAKRGGSAARGYGVKWQKKRKAVIAESPLCARCERQEPKVYSAGCQVHHIRVRWDPAYVVLTDEVLNLCEACHGYYSALERQHKRAWESGRMTLGQALKELYRNYEGMMG